MKLASWTFAVAAVVALSAWTPDCRAADCNANGRDDIDDITSGASPDCNDNAVPDECELGEDRVAYEAALTIDTGHSSAIVIIDYDGDGDGDVVLAENDGPGDPETRTNDSSIVLLRNIGIGRFAEPLRIPLTGQVWDLYADDLDGDEAPDLVLGYEIGATGVALNRGDGSFDAPVVYTAAGRPYSKTDEVAADLDGDGDADVVTGSLSYEGDVVVMENISGGAFTRGCNDFLRGDANTDGVVSISDVVTLRRLLFEGSVLPSCFDAADASDNDDVTVCDAVVLVDALFRNPGWSQALPAPSPEPGRDPTPLSEAPAYACDSSGAGRSPLDCRAYDVQPPQASDDLVRIGDADGVPGATVAVPVYLSAGVAVDAFQLVVAYDPVVLEIDPETPLSFDGTYFERFDAPPFAAAAASAEEGILVAAIAGNLLVAGSEVAPGEDILVAWIHGRVSDSAPAGPVAIEPTNGPGGAGVGPHRLRNEITHKGETRFVSFFPQTLGGLLNIVGDQSLFVRADANGDWKLDISDPVHTLTALFLGGEPSLCGRPASSSGATAGHDAALAERSAAPRDGARPKSMSTVPRSASSATMALPAWMSR
jgi:hypothetical protein